MTTIAPPDPRTLTSGVRVAADSEVRTIELEDGVREVEAKICSYGVGPDTYRTTWAPGWAVEGLRETLGDGRADGTTGTPVTMVYGHDERDLNNVVGSVAGYTDKPDGLYVRLRMANFDEVPSARIAYSLLRDGHLRGWSYKYRDADLRPDPAHRGALQFVRARLVHVSPVTDPSIPGTATVGVRSDMSEEDAMNQAILDALTALPDSIRTATAEGVAEGLRTAGVAAPEEASSPETLALAVATALSACRAADVPEEQRLALIEAAGVANEELCEALGVPTEQVRAAQAVSSKDELDELGDKTQDEDETRAAQPYGDVEYADPGYQKDKQKRYPLDTEEHVRSALSYIGQEKNASKYSSEDLKKVKDKIDAAAKKLGIGDRSAAPIDEAIEKLNRRGIH